MHLLLFPHLMSLTNNKINNFHFHLFCTVKFYTLDDSVMFVLRRLEDHTQYSTAHSTHSNTAHSSRHHSCSTSPSAYSPPHGKNHSALHQHRAYGQNIVLSPVQSPTAAAMAREASHDLRHSQVQDVRDVHHAGHDMRKTSAKGEIDSIANGTQQLHVSISEPANLYASCLENVSSKLYHFYHFFICVVLNAGMLLGK